MTAVGGIDPIPKHVITVLGPVDPSDLGITLPHEHLLVDRSPMGAEWDYQPFDDEDLIAAELEPYRAAGGRSIVDVTSRGIGRDPSGLVRISERSGLNVVMGAGWYREAVYPKRISELTATQLADELIAEVTLGVEGTGIKPGVIGELGTERYHISPAAERVFRAAARACRETGIAISTHCTGGKLGIQQVQILEEAGAPIDRLIIGHQGQGRNIDQELAIASSGAFVQIDVVGLFTQPSHDVQMADNVAALVQAGHVDHLLISQDTCMPHQLRWHGGHGYDYLLATFVPMLQTRGLTDQQIRAIIQENPAKALAF